MTDTEEELATINEGVEEQPEEGAVKGRPLLRLLGIVFIVLAVLVAIYGTIFLVAWDRGQDQKTQEEQTALDTELEKQMNLARDEVAAGNYNLAVRRLEWVLEQNPAYPGAATLMEQAQANLSNPATPTPMLRATITPDAEQMVPTDLEPAEALTDLEQVIEQQQWEEAITAITAFQSRYPDFERRQTDTMLYNAYLNLGQQYVMGDQVELGLFYFDQAEKLGDLPIEAEDQRTWADLYLVGISYYGVDWGTAAFYFRGLCAAAPFYQDACVKLHEVLVAYADQYTLNLDYCPAEVLYSEANQISSNSAVIEKLQEARNQCLEATPTPTVTPSVPISGTETIESRLPATVEASG